MYKIIKRSGDVVDFQLGKIAAAIEKAMMACKRDYDDGILTTLALKSASMAEAKAHEGAVAVEDVQDCVERVLSESGYFDVAKSYILYREQHKKLRQAKNTLLDYQKTVDNYLKTIDWRVKESSTITYSLGGLILGNSGAITANYWLSEVYDEEVADAHRNVRMHIHDLSMLSPYCAGWNLKDLIERGIISVGGRTASKPAAHLSTLANQMVNFLGILQNEWAGAQAFSSFDTYLAPFVKADNLTYDQVKQAIQSFVFGVNTPSRWGTQPPFTNITLDWTVPDDLRDQPAIVGGKEMPFTYGDCKAEMDIVNKAFIDVMLEGDANGRGHEYPIPTYSITPDFDWSDTENNRLLFGMAAKYGIPYFSNYVNSDMKPSDIRSMCPLRADQKVLVMDDYSKEWHVSTIKNLYGGNKKDKVYDVLLNGVPHKATINKFDGLRFVKINLVNGHSVIVSTNHLNHVLRKTATGNEITDLPTDAVTPGDYLPFNIDVVEGRGLDHTDGVMVGAFMGNGTLKDDYSITFSLNNGYKSDLMGWIIDKAKTVYGAKVAINNANESGTCVNVTVTSKMLRGLIEDYVSGQGTDKVLDVKAINRSVEFRKGIIEGLTATDGTPAKHRIYTASKNGMESVCTILASLGMPTRVTKDGRSAKDGTLSDNPVWCIRPYDPENGQTSYGDVYRKAEGLMWFRIESIEPQDTTASTGYCFEVLSDDPYFMLPNGLVTHNCRLRLDLNELRRRNGGFFGSGESTGSIGVVTINMPQLAYLSANEDDFFAQLDHLMDIAARSLDTKRRAVVKWLEAGLYPYTKAYLGHFNNHFSTIGLVGMNEACLNARWIGKDMTDPQSHAFAVKVLDHMRDRLVIYQNRYKALFNLEATPAESTAFRFAKHDKEKYPDIVTANMDGTPYYTNSTNLPVGWTDDIFAALDAQDDLQVLYTSGTVFHTFLGEQMPDWRSTMQLVRRIAQNYRLPYYTLSPTYSVCHEHGYLAGEQPVCPHCGRKTEVYSRITGYYRAVQNWNDGKVQEFKDRLTYDIETANAGPGAGTRPAERKTPADSGLGLHPEPALPYGPDGCGFEPAAGPEGHSFDEEPDDEPTDHCGPDGCGSDAGPGCGPDGCGFDPVPDGCGPDGCGFDAEPDDDAEAVPGSYPVPPDLAGHAYILKTRTCPKCRMLDRALEEQGVSVPVIYAEDYMDWVRAIGAMESPTLVVDGVPVASGVAAVLSAIADD